MQIKLEKIKVRDLVKGYKNNQEEGVIGYNGLLDIRPPYQREFVYKDKQRDEVINTILKGFPLNTMYWVKNKNGTFEVLDGQQRTISVCSYISGDFSLDYKFFHNLTEGEKDILLDYELFIYMCEGSEKDKLEWFKIVNIAGEKLTSQELRNAIYTGPWLSDAKLHFSKSNCPAYNLGKNYINGKLNRQDFLETALAWISLKNECQIEDYMSEHQHDNDANELWLYYQEVLSWVQRIFPNYRKKLMKGINWGLFYNLVGQHEFNTNELEEQIQKLLLDEDVTSKKGICPYLITKDEKHLNIRSFSEKVQLEVYQEQDGICVKCGKPFKLEEMQADHIDPWSKGGKTIKENCQMLCSHCNRIKSNL